MKKRFNPHLDFVALKLALIIVAIITTLNKEVDNYALLWGFLAIYNGLSIIFMLAIDYRKED